MKTPRVVKIKDLKGHRITALWNDGTTRLHNFEPELESWKEYPGYKMLTNKSIFGSVEVSEDGCLTWPNVTYDEQPSKDSDDWITFDTDRMYEEGEVLSERHPALKLAHLVSSIRQSLGLTQEQVAVRTGVTKSYISKIERGVTDINLGTFEWLLEFGFGKRIEIVDIEPTDSSQAPSDKG